MSRPTDHQRREAAAKDFSRRFPELRHCTKAEVDRMLHFLVGRCCGQPDVIQALKRELKDIRTAKLLDEMDDIVKQLPKWHGKPTWFDLQARFTRVNAKLARLQGTG